jgi:UDP-glucose:tetrahydrobiopterin glucosyltransferase
MRPVRILLLSTPVGALGTGTGGGVELTVVNTAATLAARGHRVTVIAPEGSRLEVPGVALVQRPGAPPPSAQHQLRDTPIVMPAGGVLAAMCEAAFAAQGDVDLVVNYAYDWLPLYLTPFFRAPLLHLIGMGSLTDAVDGAIAGALGHRPGGVAVHTRAQAATFAFGDRLRLVGNGVDVARYRYRPRSGPSLGWVARIAPEKGLEDAVAAASLVESPLDVWGIVEDTA